MCLTRGPRDRCYGSGRPGSRRRGPAARGRGSGGADGTGRGTARPRYSRGGAAEARPSSARHSMAKSNWRVRTRLVAPTPATDRPAKRASAPHWAAGARCAAPSSSDWVAQRGRVSRPHLPSGGSPGCSRRELAAAGVAPGARTRLDVAPAHKSRGDGVAAPA